MGVLFGLGAALVWGAADFYARLSSERIGARRTLFWMQVLGALMTGLLLCVPALRPHALPAPELALAVAIGALNALGGLLLYRSLEIGTVSLVSPVSSTFAAIAAVLAIGAGERPTSAQIGGLLLAALGVVGAAIPPRVETAPPGSAHASRRGVGLAALAAVSWGLSFFALRYVVGPLGSVFPVFISRVTSMTLIFIGSRALSKPLEPPRGALHFVAAIALFDSAAFVLYNLGVATALTAVVAVLSSLYSAVTVVLAFIFLRERLSRMQWTAVVVILAGVGLVSSAG
jgi:drug/metabolite transporter (DMT)-like permease